MAAISCTSGLQLSVEDIVRSMVDIDAEGNITLNVRYIPFTTVAAATYDLLTTDYLLHVTYTATGTVAITLPTAQVIAGRRIFIKDAAGNSGANNITISTEGTEKIDGANTLLLNANYEAFGIYCDGSNWFTFTS